MKRLVMALSLLAIFPLTAFAADIDSVVSANNQFAFDLYRHYRSKPGNIFFSPYSISTALAMTYEGAQGKTAEEMHNVLHFPLDAGIRRQGFSDLYNKINRPGKSYELNTANALWAQESYSFLKEYFSIIDTHYQGKATNLDFVNRTEESRLTINKWVEERTKEKIKDLIPSGSINQSTRLVLTNAIYFKDLWFTPFDKQDTQEADFSVSVDNKVRVQMMYKEMKKCGFYFSDKLQVLKLPYQGRGLAMFIILPKTDYLNEVEESLDTSIFSKWESMVGASAWVKVYLPRFKIETKYLMNKDLVEMGMPTAFDEKAADFSGMTGKRDLMISQLIHQAFVEVNEEGTEAAAATAVNISSMSGMLPRLQEFKADHPFIFLIKDEVTGAILFVGRVNNPNDQS